MGKVMPISFAIQTQSLSSSESMINGSIALGYAENTSVSDRRS